MAKWKIQLVGPLTLLRDGESVRLRTRQQALLLALLAVHAPHPLARAEAATLLWPSAPRTNALTYLRRAVMELRELGIDVASTREEVSLGADAVASDLDEPSVTERPFLEGIDHPVADEIRRFVVKRRKRGVVATKGTEEPPSGAEAWLTRSLLRDRPEIVMEMIALDGLTLVTVQPPREVLALCERVLAASKEDSKSRGAVLMVAARACGLLTLYGRAERYLEASLVLARQNGDQRLEARALTTLGFLYMETRRWDSALAIGFRAIRVAEVLGEPDLTAQTHGDLAGILWHRLDFAAAAEHYLVAAKEAVGKRVVLTVLANHAYIWAVFGVPFDPPGERPAAATHEAGLAGTAEAYLYFSLHVGFGEYREAARWAARHLELTVDEGKERYVCIALDCAAIVLGHLGLSAEAAATVRLGSRLRWSLGHRRSPAEALAIRRHVVGDFFAPETTRVLATLDDEEPAHTARRLAARLRLHALG